MFLSAVSVGLAIATMEKPQVGRLSQREQQVWQRMAPGVLTILQNGRPMGPAALIDSSGLFIAHRNAVLADSVSGVSTSGNTVQLHVRGQDEITQLVLLQATEWDATRAMPFKAPDGVERQGGTLLAILTTGPIRAEFVSNQRMGVVKPSRRLVPLNEFRFEAPATEVGTALVVSESGEFLGALHATLTPTDTGSTPGNALRNGTAFPIPGKPKFGPAEMTVAYSAGAPLVRRVLAGFKSPKHEVVYPALGVMCNDNVGGGATVQQVTAGSPAAQAGMRVGDIMLDIDGRAVRNQFDFAKIMLDQEPGKKIVIRIKRGSQIRLLDVVVGKAE